MVRDISVLVDNLTHLLRYISGGTVSGVTIADEVEYARRYLSCMKIRFSNSLFYDIAVPGEIAQVKVPKLIIQPLIENALKYGMSAAPPWSIRVSGEAEDGAWRIEVSDNGPGFSGESLFGCTREDGLLGRRSARRRTAHPRHGPAEHLLPAAPLLRQRSEVHRR